MKKEQKRKEEFELQKKIKQKPMSCIICFEGKK